MNWLKRLFGQAGSKRPEKAISQELQESLAADPELVEFELILG